MVQGGKKSLKKTDNKPKAKKTSLTVKVHASAIRTEKKSDKPIREKPAVVSFDKPKEKIAESKQKRSFGLTKKNRTAGFMQGDFSDMQEAEIVIAPNIGSRAEQEEYPKIIKARIISAKTARSKEIIMIAGVAFFMILVLGLWIFQIKQNIRAAKIDNVKAATDDWRLAIDDIGGKIQEMKSNLEEVKSFAADVASSTADRDAFASSTVPVELPAGESATTTQTIATSSINELIKKLEKED